MATVLTRSSRRGLAPPDKSKPKTYTQTVSIGVGCFMILIGLSGLLNPEFLGLHLSAMHSLVLSAGGCFAIHAGTIHDTRKAYRVSLGLGFFFALNAIAGFLLGQPGTPNVGYDAPDDLLLRLAPGLLELATLDHVFHSLLSIFFLSGAYSWQRNHFKKKVGHEA